MLGWLSELLEKFKDTLLSVLPHSPFQKFISSISEIPYLDYLNWFLPIKAMLVIFTVWLSAVALFYIYSIIMRWVKMIGD